MTFYENQKTLILYEISGKYLEKARYRMKRERAPTYKDGAFPIFQLLQTSVGLAAKERRDIQVIIALWGGRNGNRTAVRIQPLRRRTARVL